MHRLTAALLLFFPRLSAAANVARPGAPAALSAPAALPALDSSAALNPALPSALPAALSAAPAALPASLSAVSAAEEALPQAALALPAADIQAAALPTLGGAALETGAPGVLRASDETSGPGTQDSLRTGAEALGDAQAGEHGHILQSMFDGPRGVPAQWATTRIHQIPDMGTESLEGHARWWEAPVEERVLAVRRLGELGGEAAKAALVRVAEAGQNDLADYEVHRAALKELAERHGDLRSLAPVNAAQKAELLASLRKDKPVLAVSDYDDTASAYNQPLAAHRGALIQGARKAGVGFAFLSDRPDKAGRPGEVGVLDSLAAIPAERKAGVLVATNKGLKISELGADGEARLLEQIKPSWSAAQKTSLEAGRDLVLARYATQEFPAGSGVHWKLDDVSLVIFLKVGTDQAATNAAAALLQAELVRRGMGDYEVLGRMPKDATNPPYLSVSIVNKSAGTGALTRRFGVPGGARVLLLGDQFMTQGSGRPTDSFMIDGAPQATVIAVGPTADPRYGNAYLWDRRGPDGWDEVVSALGN